MNIYFYQKAQERGLVIADFDLGYTNHLYDVQRKRCLCGHYKNIVPARISLPQEKYFDYPICGSCEHIIKKMEDKP